MTCFVGIDPGLHGGIAVLNEPAEVSFAIMPVNGGVICTSALRSYFYNDWSSEHNTRIIIEKVGAMPKQGVSSTFKFGMGYGQLIGMCQTLELPFTLVTPQAWKKAVLAGTDKSKEAAIAFCRREYPNVNLIPERCRVPHDGIADALCLAHYGRYFMRQEVV